MCLLLVITSRKPGNSMVLVSSGYSGTDMRILGVTVLIG